MQFTGEFYVPEQHGNIELEHVHRYLQATRIVAGKSVLDIACGEGYGSSLLAAAGATVTGVDISEEVIAHARARYPREGLSFLVGDCAAMPIADRSVDVVVSFETIEHHDQHDAMMREIKRVLRPDGCLLISTPDRLHYSIEPGSTNPFHVKELLEEEFKSLIRTHFRKAAFFGQRIAYGSAILSDESTQIATCFWRDQSTGEIRAGNNRPLYWIALASDSKLPELGMGMFEQPIDDTETVNAWRAAAISADEAASTSRAQADESRSQADESRSQADELRAIVRRSRAAMRQAQRRLATVAEELKAERAHLDQVRVLADHEKDAIAAREEELAIQGVELSRLRVQAEELMALRSSRLLRLRDAVRQGPLTPRKIGRIGKRSLALVVPRSGPRRKQSIASSHRESEGVPGFDPVFYLKTYPDVAAAAVDPLDHYLQYGKSEGRLPRDPRLPADGEHLPRTEGVPGFDPVYYLKTYPDVAAAGVDPLDHYLRYGRSEGRRPRDPRVPADDVQLPEFAIPARAHEYLPLVSIIVPCYNHADFLEDRLASIYSQTYRGPVEIFLLDDVSSDCSLEILHEFAGRYPDRTTVVANSVNSGSAFRQWRRGFALAKGEVVWIAESDDLCDLNLLETLVPLMANSAVMLAFARTLFFREAPDDVVFSLEEYLHDLVGLRFDVEWTRPARDLVTAGFYDRNLVPNVSGALLRHPGSMPLLDDPEWQAMQLAGDWLFYLELIRGGLVAFSPATTDYHRSNESTLTTQVGKTPTLALEIERVRSAAGRIYGLDAIPAKFRVAEPGRRSGSS
jgi:SAM-dependent methyltransferase